MKLAELQKKVAEVLGVSSSQKELAFEIFIDNVYDTLSEGLTIKVPRIGFFQKKKSVYLDEVGPLLFCPLSGEIHHDSSHLFLTIEVLPKIRETVEINSTVFSIGVGKPIIPLNIDDMPDTETSYVILKKSIEERVKELITESDLLPGFKIWDEYYNAPEKYIDSNVNDGQTQLAELTYDLNFQEHEEPKNIPQQLFEDDKVEHVDNIEINKEQVNKEEDKFSDLHELVENEKDTLFDLYESKINLDEISDQTIDEETLVYEPQDNIDKPLGSLTVAELMDDVSIKKDSAELENKETIENAEKSVPEKLSVEEKSKDEIKTTEPSENIEEKNEIPLKIDEESLKTELSQAESTDESDLIEDNDEADEELVFKRQEKIEWNWGDDLKEEFGVSPEEDADYEMMEESPDESNIRLIDEKIETGKRFTRDLFKQLEKTLEREIAAENKRQEEINYTDENRITRDRTFQFRKPTEDQSDRSKKVVLEFSGPPVKYEFVEDKGFEKDRRMAITLVDEEPKPFYDPYEKPRYRPVKEDKYFNKTFMIIFSAFVVIISVVIFLIMKSNNPNQLSNISDKSNSTMLNESSSMSYKSEAELREEQAAKNAQNLGKANVTLSDEYNGFPAGETPPVAIKNLNSESGTKTKNQPSQTENDLFKSSTSDTRISGSIYFDGKTYNYQTSSWRNRDKAEQEARRLRALGFTAFIMEVFLPQKGGTWYRVRVGSFNSAKEAQDFINKNKL